jgi:hypothetical protein
MVEQLAEHCAAHQATEKIAGEISAAGHPAIHLCRLPDKAGGAGLCKESPDSDERHPGEHVREVR